MTCPHCGAEAIAHEGNKEGYFHCNVCGCCFDAQGVQFPGHPLGKLCGTAQGDSSVSPAEGPVLSEPAAEPSKQGRKSRGSA